MKRVAMVSHNLFVRGQDNGWVQQGDNQVLIIQGLIEGDEEESLWRQLDEALPTIDHVVVYVGKQGSERAINLVAAHSIPQDRITFVMCACNQDRKVAPLRERGYTESCVLLGGCGGDRTMLRLYREALASK